MKAFVADAVYFSLLLFEFAATAILGGAAATKKDFFELGADFLKHIIAGVSIGCDGRQPVSIKMTTR